MIDKNKLALLISRKIAREHEKRIGDLKNNETWEEWEIKREIKWDAAVECRLRVKGERVMNETT